MRLLSVLALVAAPTIVLAQEAPPPPLLTIGLSAQAPVIDGVLDDPAWEGAAGFCGMVPIGKDALAEDRTTVRVTYTAERIYVAFECALTDGAPPISTAVGHDLGRPWREDAIEVYLAPDPANPADNFQLIGSSAGGIFDLRAGDPAWNGAWEFATAVDAVGRDHGLPQHLRA